ncbi:30S ribosomal protein S31, mitochondrial [Phalaenopsis equestris]|uniref:30S ribosomal protein S31, mitochondrial n=1 Tax=Phalaenopsis equestris TaxID=78828 RepID=UPI0009E4EEA0|nr:30S ribosomal protein S31, mitochondrial [Phalaenopsis equestris]
MAMRLLGRRWMQQLKEQRVIFSNSHLTSSSFSPATAETGLWTCGRGDKKTKRGKRFKGSFGNARPKKEKKIQRIKDRIEVPRSTPWPLPFKLI